MRAIVVGAGLAGLSAAVRLADAGCEVVVLEGRDEIGGRSRSRQVDGAVIELGGQFLSRPHHRMRKLVADAGLHLRRTRLWAGTVRVRRENTAQRLLSTGSLRDLAALRRIAFGADSLAAARSLVDARRIAEQDARSVHGWLDDIGLSGPLRPTVETMIGQTFGGADPKAISLLAFADLVGGEGNGLLFVLDGFGLTDYIVEGTGALCAALAARLPEPVRCAMPVVAVEQDAASIAVRVDDGQVFDGDHVVLAVPSPMVGSIAFSPALPPAILEANAAIRYGNATKVAAVVGSGRPPLSTGFLGGSVVRQGWRVRNVLYGLAEPSGADIDAPQLVADLCRGFGVDPGRVSHSEVVDWQHDPLTKGTYGHFPPGAYDPFRRSLPHHVGRLHLAGAERSTRPGFMEGALESGDNAAEAILRAVR